MLNLVFLFLLIFTVNSREIANIRNDMTASLLSRVNEKRASPSISLLMTDLSTTGPNLIGQVKTEAEISTLGTKNALPAAVVTALKNALKAKAEKKDVPISYKLQNSHLSMSEIMGVCRYEESQLHYILIVAKTTGKAAQVIETKYKHQCVKYRKHFKKHKKCWNEPFTETRANNDTEIATMKKASLSRSIEYIKSQYYVIKENIAKSLRDVANKNLGQTEIVAEEAKTAYTQSKKITFIQNLRTLVDKTRVLPTGYATLIRNIRTHSYVNMDTFTVTNANSIIDKYDLPTEVKTQLKTLSVMSGDIAKKEIKYITDKTNAYLLEVLGIFSKVGNNLFFIYIKSESMGDIPVRKKMVEKKFCYHEWFKKKCKHYKEAVDDPYNTSEIATVKNALKALNMQSIGKKLDAMNESQALLSEKTKLLSANKVYAATMNSNGIAYIGKAADPIKNSLHTLGTAQPKENAPYSLQVTQSGNIYIINKNGDKVWSTNTSYKGTAPYKIVLDNNGILTLYDSQSKAVFMAK